MGNSKIIFGNETLMDLTGDTVNANNLLAGATAHGADGDPIVGEMVVVERKILTQTLVAGQTSLTFTDASITENALVDIYVNHADAFPTDFDDSVSGSITLTFDVQIADLSVKLVIS